MKEDNFVRLVGAMILERDSDVLELCLDSIIPYVDAFYVIYSPQEGDGVRPILDKYDKLVVEEIPFLHEDKGADGKQRNNYLRLLEKRELGSWCLVLDADEFVDDGSKIRGLCESAENNGFDCISPKMRHLIHNFGFEDATHEKHFVPNRLFKVQKGLNYPAVEHPTLRGWSSHVYEDAFVVWHVNNARNMTRLLGKYKNNLSKSNIHKKDFLVQWYHSLLFNFYPIRPVHWNDLPQVMVDHFLIEKDYLYFKDRMNLETKHFLDAIIWKEHFKPESVLFAGCGAGHRVFCMNSYGVPVRGFDLSEWVIDNTPYRQLLKNNSLFVDDILCLEDELVYDLVVAYDILEHLTEEELLVALNNLRGVANKYLLISVPFEGDPNLYNDPTHKIFRDRAWWEEQVVNAGFKLLDVPYNFLFRHQLIVAEVDKNGS